MSAPTSDAAEVLDDLAAVFWRAAVRELEQEMGQEEAPRTDDEGAAK